MGMCIYSRLYLSLCLFIYLFYLIYPSIYESAKLSTCHLPMCSSIYLSAYVFIYHLSLYLIIYLSIWYTYPRIFTRSFPILPPRVQGLWDGSHCFSSYIQRLISNHFHLELIPNKSLVWGCSYIPWDQQAGAVKIRWKCLRNYLAPPSQPCWIWEQ